MSKKEGLDRLVDEKGKIVAWPKDERDRKMVMEYLAGKFEDDRIYKEKEVNEIIVACDGFMNPTMLRRELIGRKLLERKSDCTAYWKVKADRYGDVKERLLELAREDEKIKAVIAIGSSTRESVKADEYSDLDLMIATEDPEGWISGDMPLRLGDFEISFVEPTLGGGMERRVFFSGYRDTDMLIYTPLQMTEMIEKGEASWVMNRGYKVLFDRGDFTSLLEKKIDRTIHGVDLSQDEFLNLTENFYFHIIWSLKKIKRGELLSAKFCIDGHMKNLLLKMMEMYSHVKYGRDTWHDGRFFESWAEEEMKEQVRLCFAHYDRDDMVKALGESEKLFTRLADEVAAIKVYKFDHSARDYALGFFVQ